VRLLAARAGPSGARARVLPRSRSRRHAGPYQRGGTERPGLVRRATLRGV